MSLSSVQKEIHNSHLAKIDQYVTLNESVMNIDQQPYKDDFFKLFHHIYKSTRQDSDLNSSLNEDVISTHLKELKRKPEMIKVIKTWWKEWSYALDKVS